MAVLASELSQNRLISFTFTLVECSSVAEWITGSSVFIIWKLADIGLGLGLCYSHSDVTC